MTVTVNVYWDMTPFSLADRYNSYVEKSWSAFFFPESLQSVYQVHDVTSWKTTFHTISEYM